MKKRLFPLLSLLLIVGLTGCSGVKNSMRLSEKDSVWNPVQRLAQDKKDKQKEDAKPATMAAIWADSVMEYPGKPAVKGFGGRIFFYDENNTAVKADGELIVYGFEETAVGKTDKKADRKFVFQQDKFQSHYSENTLGGSYSVWLPWESVGGFRKSIVLIPMFRTADGALIKCSQSISTLPGKLLEDEKLAIDEPKQPYKVLGSSPAVVQQANYQPGTPVERSQAVSNAGFESESAEEKKIQTSTIRMNPSMSRRLSQGNLNRVSVSESKRVFGMPMPTANESTAQRKTDSKTESQTTESALSSFPAQPANAKPKSSGTRTFGQPGSWQ